MIEQQFEKVIRELMGLFKQGSKDERIHEAL